MQGPSDCTCAGMVPAPAPYEGHATCLAKLYLKKITYIFKFIYVFIEGPSLLLLWRKSLLLWRKSLSTWLY